MKKRLYKSRNNRVIEGVCGGIGEYFEIDPVIVRLVWVFAILAAFSGVIAYVIACFIIPDNRENDDNNSRNDNDNYYY